jgi:hypothetical protein
VQIIGAKHWFRSIYQNAHGGALQSVTPSVKIYVVNFIAIYVDKPRRRHLQRASSTVLLRSCRLGRLVAACVNHLRRSDAGMRSWQWHVQPALLGSIMQPCTRRQEQANSNNKCKIDALIGVKFVIWCEIIGKVIRLKRIYNF